MWPTWQEHKAFSVILFLLLLAGVGYFGAKTAESIRSSMEIGKPAPYEHTIFVEGVGKATGVPDTATISFTVESRGASTVEAQDANTKTMNTLLEKVRASGIPDGDVQSSSYNVWQDSIWNVETQTTELGDWIASQSVTVTVHNVASVGSLLALLGQNGATNISGPNYELKDASEAQAQARAEAIDDATKKAQMIASQLHLSLDRIVGYSEYIPTDVPLPYYDARMSGMGGGAAPELSVGSAEVSLTATITYRLVE